MSEFVSVERINTLKSGIESKTGEAYTDLTAGVRALVDGYGIAPVLTDLVITENGEYTPPDGVDGFGKVTANVAASGGEGNVFQVVSSTCAVGIWDDIPETIHLHFLVKSSLSCKITTDQTDKLINLIITGVTPSIDVTAFSGGNKSTNVKSLDFSGNVVSVYWDETFRYCSNLTGINAILDFSTATKWDRTFYSCSKLVEMRWLVNSVSASGIPMRECSSLSDDSIVSVANALIATTAGDMSWTLHATPKARCDEILGTVSQVTQDDGTTYDFFTTDSAGTVTLSEFITVTKGWTLA